MENVRGFLMIVVGAFALFRGLVLHSGRNAWVLTGLGVLAIGLGVWHLTRKRPRRLR
jgi:hypothetical protein